MFLEDGSGARNHYCEAEENEHDGKEVEEGTQVPAAVVVEDPRGLLELLGLPDDEELDDHVRHQGQNQQSRAKDAPITV
ncbi:hypothetical protein [Arthrobacter sp. JCM 19049]|uniref:hypothetical protein n=1 Tax=Arthrobacter sp. JCM 19049 TaxID=1460643 RepID=UPI00243691A9|nr:hypothetical protein [Arthrobacter sp. JCM 19049]